MPGYDSNDDEIYFYDGTVGSRIDAALVYGPGNAERGKFVGILSNVSADLILTAPAFMFV